MKKGIFAIAALAALSSQAAKVTADKAAHSVSFTAVAAGHDTDTPIEFLLATPSSDHEYEALFLTEASAEEIAKGMEEAGIPRGSDFDALKWKLWPVGEEISMTPAFTNLLKDTRSGSTPRAIYTGGSLKDGKPVADSDTPGAVFALYNCPQSLFQLDDSLGQSETYGRFRPARKFEKGEKVRFTLSWSGKPTHEKVVLELKRGTFKENLTKLKEKSAKGSLDVLCDFSPDLTVHEAAAISQVLASLDSPLVKFNGAPESQLYFRAYLPLEKWRDRAERLAQPPEVHFLKDGTFMVKEIVEDWSDEESLDPKLSVKDHPAKDIAEAAKLASQLAGKTYTLLVFAPSATKLEKIHELKGKVTGQIMNWYVFPEDNLGDK